ncbi:MAG: hypothetical protein WCK79_08070 [Actinomycetes bacterium]|jgi:hypothetical protein
MVPNTQQHWQAVLLDVVQRERKDMCEQIMDQVTARHLNKECTNGKAKRSLAIECDCGAILGLISYLRTVQ